MRRYDRIMLLKLPTALTLAAIFLSQQGQAQSVNAAAVLSGCNVDTSGSPLPGTAIDIVGPRVARSVRSEADGCYRIEVPDGTYEVSAALQGFQTVTRHDTRISAGSVERINFILGLGGICECIMYTVDDLWRAADTVLHIRIERAEQDTSFAAVTPATKYTARVLTRWKATSSNPVDGSIQFLQFVKRRQPYSAGAELVVFLRWNSRYGIHFGGYDFNGDRPAAFLIENDRIGYAILDEYTGKPAGTLISDLQRLQRN